jgi:hypothetical protein
MQFAEEGVVKFLVIVGLGCEARILAYEFGNPLVGLSDGGIRFETSGSKADAPCGMYDINFTSLGLWRGARWSRTVSEFARAQD